MVPLIGSGKFITAAIITDDGRPIEESTNENEKMRDNGDMCTSSINSDKKVIQWKLLLHQIGMYVFHIAFFLAHLELKTYPSQLHLP